MENKTSLFFSKIHLNSSIPTLSNLLRSLRHSLLVFINKYSLAYVISWCGIKAVKISIISFVLVQVWNLKFVIFLIFFKLASRFISVVIDMVSTSSNSSKFEEILPNQFYIHSNKSLLQLTLQFFKILIRHAFKRLNQRLRRSIPLWDLSVVAQKHCLFLLLRRSTTNF